MLKKSVIKMDWDFYLIWSCWSSGSRAKIVEIGKEVEEVIRLKI